MNCTICGKPVELTPSAEERSRKYGQPDSFYTHLFTVHAECQLEKRKLDTTSLVRRVNSFRAHMVSIA